MGMTYCDNDKYCNYLSCFLTGEWNSVIVWGGRSYKRRPNGNLWAGLHCNQQIFEENYFPFGSGLQTRLCITAQIFTAVLLYYFKSTTKGVRGVSSTYSPCFVVIKLILLLKKQKQAGNYISSNIWVFWVTDRKWEWLWIYIKAR